MSAANRWLAPASSARLRTRNSARAHLPFLTRSGLGFSERRPGSADFTFSILQRMQIVAGL